MIHGYLEVFDEYDNNYFFFFENAVSVFVSVNLDLWWLQFHKITLLYQSSRIYFYKHIFAYQL